jgi:glutaminase
MRNINVNNILENVYKKYKVIQDGHLPSYIPELTKADPNLFAISIATQEGECYSIGDYEKEFTIQSIVKPFMHGLVLEVSGREAVLAKIGVEPTGDPYNSIKLQPESYRPYNPMVNAGAIALASMIPGGSSVGRVQRIKELLEVSVGHQLGFDEKVYMSEKTMGHHNRAMAYLMLNFGILDGDPEEILDTYFQACSFLVTVQDIAMMGATLANKGVHPLTGQCSLESKWVRDVLCVMLMCGMYDFAGEWAYTVGIPAKSGVSGGILGVVPGRMGIAVFSPLLDKRGNSVRGIRTFQDLSLVLDLSIFE